MKKGDYYMTNKMKLLMATSLVAFVTTGCSTAPAPWAQTKNGGGSNGKGVTHSHNGQVHTHPLPSSGIHHSHRQGGASGNASNYGSSSSNNNAGGVTHTHDGIRHTHPLPSSGLNHSHGGGYGKAIDGGSYTDTYGGYGNNSNNSYDDGYYDSEYGNRNNRDRYNDRYNDGSYSSGRGSYYDDYGSNRDSGSRDTSRDDDSSDYASSIDPSSNYDGGDTYVVRRKDTVFEVMRQTGAYWKDIIRLNDLKAPKYEIHPGQRLKLPKDHDSK